MRKMEEEVLLTARFQKQQAQEAVKWCSSHQGSMTTNEGREAVMAVLTDASRQLALIELLEMLTALEDTAGPEGSTKAVDFGHAPDLVRRT